MAAGAFERPRLAAAFFPEVVSWGRVDFSTLPPHHKSLSGKGGGDMTEEEARAYIAGLTAEEKWRLNELLKQLEKARGPAGGCRRVG